MMIIGKKENIQPCVYLDQKSKNNKTLVEKLTFCYHSEIYETYLYLVQTKLKNTNWHIYRTRCKYIGIIGIGKKQIVIMLFWTKLVDLMDALTIQLTITSGDPYYEDKYVKLTLLTQNDDHQK